MLWHCTSCTASYSPRAPRCPHCGGTDYEEDGAMPKTHADGSVTDAARDAELAAQAPEVTEAAPAVEPEPEPDERPSPRKRTRRDATANAGHATGAGGAGSVA